MEYVYETPWWLPTLIALIGVVLYVTGRNGSDKRLAMAGVGVIGVAALLVLVSWLLESDREKVVRNTNSLINAVEKRDWNRMSGLLHPDVTLSADGTSESSIKGKEVLVALTRGAAEQIELGEINQSAAMKTEIQDERIYSEITVFAKSKQYPGGNSAWRLEWVKRDKDWVLYDIEPRDTLGFRAESVGGFVRGIGEFRRLFSGDSPEAPRGRP